MSTETESTWKETVERHHWRLRAVEDQVSALLRPPPERTWLDGDLTEPAVQVALRDLVRGGDCVFDVGANFGGLTMLMSRLVGPRGQVCAFEANPAIARECLQFLTNCGCGNVQLHQNAVYHSSLQSLSLYVSDNRVSDSLYNKVSDRTISVMSLALDDLVDQLALAPSVVKMDIEGAEYDALQGFERTISSVRPLLILEQQLADERCLAWLRERGYMAVDLYEFKAIEHFGELTRGTDVSDLLYVPHERVSATPYYPPFEFEPVARLNAADFGWVDDHVFLTREPVPLSGGRYRAVADFSATHPQCELKTGIAEGLTPLMRYHGSSGWLARTGRHWIFDAPRPMAIRVFFEFPGEVDPSFALESITIERLPQFDRVPRRAWV